jgi:hypothetical protein
LVHELVREHRRPHGDQCAIESTDRGVDGACCRNAQRIEGKSRVLVSDGLEPGLPRRAQERPPGEEAEMGLVEDPALVVVEASGDTAGAGIPMRDISMTKG